MSSHESENDENNEKNLRSTRDLRMREERGIDPNGNPIHQTQVEYLQVDGADAGRQLYYRSRDEEKKRKNDDRKSFQVSNVDEIQKVPIHYAN
jgi:hypothetical protein